MDQYGRILDGHNRVEIAKKHGLEYKTIRRTFKTDAEAQEHVLMLNMARRHLRPHQWGGAFKRLLELKGVKRGSGGDHKSKDRDQTDNVTVCSDQLGVDDRTARRRMAAHDAYEQLPEEAQAKVDAGEASPASELRKIRQKNMREDAAKTAELTGRYSVIGADPPWRYGATTAGGSIAPCMTPRID
ncbi:MAG: hypothetical protein JXA90_10505 [Planctomycetes bacterium]|nr:hypothetical protein [Planctomycetota bacterium]